MTTRIRAATSSDIDGTKLARAGLTSVQWETLLLVAFAHLLVVEVLILQPIWLVQTTNMPTLLAVPISQIALVMLWDMAGSGRSYARLPIAIVAVTVTLYFTVRFVGTVSVSVGAASWFAAFAAESSVIIVGMFGLHRGITCGPKRNQFGVFAIMAWTAIIVIVMGLLR